jgi:zinc/manganese transport system substrate-binding protein
MFFTRTMSFTRLIAFLRPQSFLHPKTAMLSHIFAASLLAAPLSAEPLKVVASFSILADMSARIAGPDATITTLVGPGSDAHVYRATPQDAKAVKEAGLVIINGLGFEGFMERLAKSAGGKAAVVTASAGIQPLSAAADEARGHTHSHSHAHDHGKTDPHAWQSLEAAKTYIANIRDGLAKADPTHAEGFRTRADAYLKDIDALQSDMKAAFATIPRERRVIVTSHDALAYFGREFGFDLHPIQGLSTEAEPTAKDVARISKLSKAKKAGAIFVESIKSPKLAAQIAKETGAKLGGTLYSDSLSDEKGEAPTYIAMMRHNMRAIVAALKE